MKHKILSDLKKYIKLGLDDRIYHIIKDKKKVTLLSKYDLIHLMKFMNKIDKHPVCFLEYIYLKSIYRYDFKIQLDNTLLMQKCQFGHFEVLKFLLSDQIRAYYPNIDPSADNNYAIRFASKNGHFEVVQFLLSDQIRAYYPNIDPSANNNQAIRCASENGHIKVVRFLLSDNIRSLFLIDPSAYNNFAIRFASQNGHIKVVRFLLSDNIRSLFLIDPSAMNNCAIRFASRCGHTNIVKLLLQDTAVLNKGLDDAIYLARCSSDRQDILDLLLSIHKN